MNGSSHLTANRHTFPTLLIAGLFVLFSGFAVAEAPQQKTQVPGYYRTFLGKFEVTALYDGAINLDTKLLKNTSDKDIQKLLARLFVKGPAVQTAVMRS